MNSRFSPEQIADLVMTLVGEIEPQGDFYIDASRYYSLQRLEIVLDLLIEKVYEVTKNRNEISWSMCKQGLEAWDWLNVKKREIEEWLNDDD